MDISELDQDVIVQQSSAGLIADFDRSLGPFLRKPNGQLRTRVRVREVSRLTSQVLEPFQELPQLLDSHLPRWLPALAEAYLACLSSRHTSRTASARSQWLTSLPDAICKVLYAFCKIRGDKVIVRFLNVETRYLELVLRALERAELNTPIIDPSDGEGVETKNSQWSWHERYIILLWLSQLFFAPFDLATISSGDADELEQPSIPGFQWPANVPGITLRVIPLAMKFLASPGKERDGARTLLVRLAMRRDMQEAGVLDALVHWSLYTLQATPDAASKSPYYYIGSLSFIAGVLRSAMDTSIMNPYLSKVFYAIEEIASGGDQNSELVKGSALARKMMIKVVRSVATLVLRKQDQSMADSQMIETSIGYLLERLADNDTPVRLAASKALSVITLKLESDMASQVVSAVLESLNRNVLWLPSKNSASAPPTRDLTAVDPLEWHGLMLTLAHLLYRRSPPTEDLSDIVHALLMGLTFDKRSPSGSLIGSNVRDAACFGIWALARRYSTAELLLVPTNSVQIARGHDASVSILQVIATELVVTASLDPAGNIRRGSSAALQELIGRHPDTVDHGIAVVQAVDYHAVALRSRAIHTVALQATQLSLHYGRALLDATLGWRGVGDLDAEARRVAAQSFGNLTAELARRSDGNRTSQTFHNSIQLLLGHLSSLQVRQVEERHGLLLSLAAVLDSFIENLKLRLKGNPDSIADLPSANFIETLTAIWTNSATIKYRKSELVAEAASKLFVSASPILVLLTTKSKEEIASYLKLDELSASEVATNTMHPHDDLHETMTNMESTVNAWLEKDADEVTRPASTAALWLLCLSSPDRRGQIVTGWCETVSRTQGTQQSTYHNGHFRALVRAYEIPSVSVDVSHVLCTRWRGEKPIELRVAILQSLLDRPILQDKSDAFLSLISEGLDDYHTNARGDVGSHVRLEAIRAAKTVWATRRASQDFMAAIYPRILKLAAEKLDRVRVEAQSALAMILPEDSATTFRQMSFASEGYFTALFKLCDTANLDQQICAGWRAEPAETIASLLAGLVTSADTGNEDLVVVSRAALARFCEADDAAQGPGSSLAMVTDALVNNLRQYTKENQDRVVLPTLEVVAYLFHIGILPGRRPQRVSDSSHDGDSPAVVVQQPLNLKRLCLLVQKAGYKTGSVRKLEACIRVYGEIARLGDTKDDSNSSTDQLQLQQQKRAEGVAEAKKRLGALLLHPWPRVRSAVVDELWVMLLCQTPQHQQQQQMQQQQMQQHLTGVDWSKADKAEIKTLVQTLGLEEQQPLSGTA
ncbi:tubulin folding cofactor D C terminal-domain-containing protein [Microdochium bolleyi]|uniref:Tubulin folding cofactor D C terminal-domain-containing protein n=1 Tax=Microdochium bolleyi TaxID=196109 RepID=A0A136IKP4_9PEZI|nr:tubulin folding cofactor D C terminal-domain-containing protein [Microdochium bolleyi]